MGPLHCPLCIGLALLTMGRVAAHALLVQRINGWRKLLIFVPIRLVNNHDSKVNFTIPCP
jgi:hypothetical protein